MWVSRRHLTFLEAEITDWKQRYEALNDRHEELLRDVFSIQGATPMFEANAQNPVRDQIAPGPASWPSWRDQLEAAAAQAAEENADLEGQGH